MHKAGRLWSEAEDRALLRALMAGVSLGDLTRFFGRSHGAIEARSERVALEHIAGRPMPETEEERLSAREWGMAAYRHATVLRRRQLPQVHPRAYASWSPEEDRELLSALLAGLEIGDLATRHGRQPTAIRSRLHKLALDRVWNSQPEERRAAGG